jgi:protein-tyrosine phosphatase
MDAASITGPAAGASNRDEDAQAQPFRVLMVCTANRVRSAMAERMLLHALAEAAPHLPIDVSGAGTRTMNGLPMFPEAASELAARGIDASGFQSCALTENGVMHADLVLTATREHRSDVLERVPLALKRTFTLMEFAALVEKVDGADPRALVAEASRQRSLAPAKVDIGDPFRRSPEVHRETADQIDVAVRTVSSRLNSLVAIA